MAKYTSRQIYNSGVNVWSVEEAAKILEVSPKRVKQMIADRTLDGHQANHPFELGVQGPLGVYSSSIQDFLEKEEKK